MSITLCQVIEVDAPQDQEVAEPLPALVPLSILLDNGFAAVDNSGSTGGAPLRLAAGFVNTLAVSHVSLWNSICNPPLPRAAIRWQSTGGTSPESVFEPTNHVPADASCFVFMTDGQVGSTERLARHSTKTAHLPTLLVLFGVTRGNNPRVSDFNVSVVMAHFVAARTAAVLIVTEPERVRVIAAKGEFARTLPSPVAMRDDLLLEECPAVPVSALRDLSARVYAPVAVGTIPLEGGRVLHLDALLQYPSFDIVSQLSETELDNIARAYLANQNLPAWRARLDHWLVQVDNEATGSARSTRQEASTGLHALMRRLQMTESVQERQDLAAQIRSMVRQGAVQAQATELEARAVARRPRAIINAALAAVTALELGGMNATMLGRLSNRAARASTINRDDIVPLAGLHTEGAPEEEDVIMYETGPTALVLRAMTNVDHNTSDAALNEPLRTGQFDENDVFEPTIVTLTLADSIELMDTSPLTGQRLSVCLPIVSLRRGDNRNAVYQRLCLVFMNELSMNHVWLIALSSILRTLETKLWADPETTATGRLLQWFASEIMQHVELPVGSRLSPMVRQPINAALAAVLQDDILILHSSIPEASVILRLLNRFGAPAAFSNEDLRRSMLARIAAAVPQDHRNWLQAYSTQPWTDQGSRSLSALLTSLYETRVDAAGAHVPIAGTERLVASLDHFFPGNAVRAISSLAMALDIPVEEFVVPGLTIVALATLDGVTTPHVSTTRAVQLARDAYEEVASELTPGTAGLTLAEEAMAILRNRLAWSRRSLYPLSPFTTPFGPSVFWFYAPSGVVINMAEGFQRGPEDDLDCEVVRLTEHIRAARGHLMARFFDTASTGAFAKRTTIPPVHREMANEAQSIASSTDMSEADEAASFVCRVVRRVVGRTGVSAGNRHDETLEHVVTVLLPSLMDAMRTFPDLAATEPRPIPLLRRVRLELGNRLPDALGEAPAPIWVSPDDPSLMQVLDRVRQMQQRARARLNAGADDASAEVQAAD